MKTILFSIFFLALAVSNCWAETSDFVQLLDSIVILDSNDVPTDKTVYSYDSDLKKNSETAYVWSGDQWVGKSKTEWVNGPKDGKIISQAYKFEGNQWVNASRQEWTYDDQDRKIGSISYVWKDSLWQYDKIYSYEYNQNGECINVLTNQWQDNQWQKYSSYFMTFDTLTHYQKYDYINYQDDYEVLKDYYCSDGVHVDTMFYSQIQNGFTVFSDIYVFNWSDSGVISSELIFYCDPYSESKSLGIEITYDELGRETCFTRFGNLKTLTSYSEDGQSVELFYCWEDDQWVLDSKYETFYDNKGNESFYNLYAWQDEKWVFTCKSSTTLYYYSDYLDGIRTTQTDKHRPICKVMKDGRIFIERNGRNYDLKGRTTCQ